MKVDHTTQRLKLRPLFRAAPRELVSATKAVVSVFEFLYAPSEPLQRNSTAAPRRRQWPASKAVKKNFARARVGKYFYIVGEGVGGGQRLRGPVSFAGKADEQQRSDRQDE